MKGLLERKIGIIAPKRQNNPMTTYSEPKRGPCLTSDIEKDALCRKEQFSYPNSDSLHLASIPELKDIQ